MADSPDRRGFRPLPQRFKPHALRHRPPARLQALRQARPEERTIRLFSVSVVMRGPATRSTELHGKRRD